jgi:hypothetical protein
MNIVRFNRHELFNEDWMSYHSETLRRVETSTSIETKVGSMKFITNCVEYGMDTFILRCWIPLERLGFHPKSYNESLTQ